MRVILSAMGRAAIRDFVVAFAALATGFWAAPDLNQAYALAGAAVLAGIVAVVRGARVYIPGLSTGIAKSLGVPVAYAEVVITGLTTFGMGFIALVEGVAAAPDLDAARAAGLAGLLAIGTALTRLVTAFFTPGEPGGGGIPTPPQPVPPAALPQPLPTNPS